MEQYIRAALDVGLEEIGFLEHIECDVEVDEPTWLSPTDLDLYWEEGTELAERFQDRIEVSIGVEVGLNPEALSGLRDLIGRHPWRRVGLSYHYVLRPDEEEQFNICSRRQVADSGVVEQALVELNERYYRRLASAVAALRPTFVCHLDVVRRHLDDVSHHPSIRPVVLELLDTMAQTGTMLEINTAGYVHRPGGDDHPYPAPWILIEALRRKVPVVFCSDSHAPQQVGRYFDRAVEDCRAALARLSGPV
jgi:histidinol-phosphatase (PHP family)